MTGIEQVLAVIGSARHGGAQHKSGGEASEDAAFLAELADLDAADSVDGEIITDAPLTVTPQTSAPGADVLPAPEAAIGPVEAMRPAGAERRPPDGGQPSDASSPMARLLPTDQQSSDKNVDPGDLLLRRPLQNGEAESPVARPSGILLSADEIRGSQPADLPAAAQRPDIPADPKLPSAETHLDPHRVLQAQTTEGKTAPPLGSTAALGKDGELASLQPDAPALQKAAPREAGQVQAVVSQEAEVAKNTSGTRLDPVNTEPSENAVKTDRDLRGEPRPETALEKPITAAPPQSATQSATQAAIQQVTQPGLAQAALSQDTKPLGFVAEGALHSLAHLAPQGSAAQLQTTTAPQAFAPAPAAPQAQVSHAIALHIEKQRAGTEAGQIELRLEPEELGRLKITFTPREAGMLVTLVAERVETMELLRRNSEEFMRDLAGMGLGDAELEFGGGQGSTDDQKPTEGEGFAASVPEVDDVSTAVIGMTVADDRLDIRL